jgi:hypothetical protein
VRSKNHVIRVLRVRMRLHYTLLFACVLVIVIVTTQFPEAYTLWRRLLLGVTACFFIGVAIITRQLTIDFVAIRRHIWFKSVTVGDTGAKICWLRKAILRIIYHKSINPCTCGYRN